MTIEERTIVLDEEKLEVFAQEKKKRRRVGRFIIFWRRFRRSKVGLFGLVLIGFIVLMAILAPFIAGVGRIVPYDPEDINLPAQYLPPFSNEPEAISGMFPTANPSTAPAERTVAGLIYQETVSFVNGTGITEAQQISGIDSIDNEGTELWDGIANPGTYNSETGEINLVSTITENLTVSYRIGGKVAFKIRAAFEKVPTLAIKLSIEQDTQAALWQGDIILKVYDEDALSAGPDTNPDPIAESLSKEGSIIVSGGSTIPRLYYFSFRNLVLTADEFYWVVIDADIASVTSSEVSQYLKIAVDPAGYPYDNTHSLGWNADDGWNIGISARDLSFPYTEGFIPYFQTYKTTSRFHILGTDALGRDILSATIWGARASLTVAFVAITIQILIGVVLGALAGYYGGRIDNAIMRLTDLFLAVPTIFLLMIAITIWERISLIFIAITIGFFGWSGTARIVRAEFLSLREMEYTDAARALGVGNRGIIFRHLLPNAMAPVIVTGTLGTATAILIEAGLSFLGFGDPAAISWGTAIQWGMQGYTLRFAPWVATIPGLAIFIAVLSFNVFGDALRDALDPRLKS
ncbi:MAG: ABC transporter permease [Candidatus Hodarchaeales archaeon]|jgi:peptide/nickel transport system permease protein